MLVCGRPPETPAAVAGAPAACLSADSGRRGAPPLNSRRVPGGGGGCGAGGKRKKTERASERSFSITLYTCSKYTDWSRGWSWGWEDGEEGSDRLYSLPLPKRLPSPRKKTLPAARAAAEDPVPAEVLFLAAKAVKPLRL